MNKHNFSIGQRVSLQADAIKIPISYIVEKKGAMTGEIVAFENDDKLKIKLFIGKEFFGFCNVNYEKCGVIV